MNDLNRHVLTLFGEALECVSPEAQAAYLDRVCGNDAELRGRVEALLRAHDDAGGFLGGNPATAAERLPAVDAAPVSDCPGTVIGPYKLLQAIGEGGMGTVFMAEQTEPVQRKVALKIIKPGMDSRQISARFEAERQALALMDHPNIARVLDAGTTANGRPYFVMELVKGVPITKYCDERRLTPKQRLELFLPVCQAVQHAHQKGIIHRDLKPSNVLIALYDDLPVPKVIDFGIAKATGQKLTERTLFTEFGQVVGTLEYMSPEQAGLNQLDIDTRSDIYSLGVLLYELLTGTTPLERKRLRDGALLEVLRLIREEEPQRPSTRLSTTDEIPTVAANRGLEPRKLSGLVRGELDWIVMKALEKDRNRRYETANGFASDLQRFLADEPVQACPPSATYRLSKFLRRNKGPVLAAVLVMLALIGGIIGTTIGLLQAKASEERAQNEAWKADRERDQANEARETAQKATEAAKKATQAESEQRTLAEDKGKELRQSLYLAEMNLAGKTADADLGLARVGELLAGWQQNKPDLRGWEWYYLYGLCHRDLLTIPVSQDGVHRAAWSPDGKHLTAVGGFSTPKVWDSATGKETVIFKGRVPLGKGFKSVAWSSDGMRLALGYSGKISIWDTVKGTQQLTLPAGDVAGFVSVSWAPGGTRMASASARSVKIWDSATWTELLVLNDYSGEIYEIAWSPDGARLAVGIGRTVKIWDLATSKEVVLSTHYAAPVSGLSWSPDGRRLAVARIDGVVVWHAATAKVAFGYAAPATTVSWSPDGTRIASGGTGGALNVSDANTGKTLVTLRGHSDRVRWVSWNPAGTRLASAAADGTVKVWDAAQSNEPLQIKGHPRRVKYLSWSPNGQRLASASDDQTIKIWDVTTGKENVILHGTTHGVNSVCWSLDNARVAVAIRDRTVLVCDAATGKEELALHGHTGPVTSVSWSSDGTRLASASGDSTVKIWNAITGKPIHTLRFRERVIDPANSVCWNPTGTRLALAVHSGNIIIWDAATGQQTRVIKADAPHTLSVVWSPDGTRLASVGLSQRTVTLWDVATGTKVGSLRGHTDSVKSVSWSPDGSRLATASEDTTVKVWDAVTAREILTFKGVEPRFRDTRYLKLGSSVAWSPDGKRLAAGGMGATAETGFQILIFDASNGYRLADGPLPGTK